MEVSRAMYIVKSAAAAAAARANYNRPSSSAASTRRRRRDHVHAPIRRTSRLAPPHRPARDRSVPCPACPKRGTNGSNRRGATRRRRANFGPAPRRGGAAKEVSSSGGVSTGVRSGGECLLGSKRAGGWRFWRQVEGGEGEELERSRETRRGGRVGEAVSEARGFMQKREGCDEDRGKSKLLTLLARGGYKS